MIIGLMLVSLVVGLLIGAIGIGGILLIPAVNLLAGLTIHASMSTALFTFMFTGMPPRVRQFSASKSLRGL